MRSPKSCLWLLAWLPCSLLAAAPHAVVITDDRVVIDGTVVAANEKKRNFQISREKTMAALGKRPKVSQSWTYYHYTWEEAGIGLGYRGDIQQCTGLWLTVREDRKLVPMKNTFTGMLSVNGVPITPLTDPTVFRKLGFKKSEGRYVRSVGQHDTEVWVDGRGRVISVSVDLPKIAWRVID